MQKLLFTGGTGFLGNNILPLLSKLYNVTLCGISSKDNIFVDLSKEIPVFNEKYDIVLHAAGLAHRVPKTESEAQLFYDINYQGTVNLCNALKFNEYGLPKSLIFISTMSVYDCEEGVLLTEDCPRGGDTPYSKSKIMAEDFLTDWCAENDVILGILRPSLLAGHNAPGNLGAMVNGIKKGLYLNIEGGKAKKSVLMADDIARILPLIAAKGGTYNICDNYNPSFGELSISIAKQLGKRKPTSIPYWIALCMAKVGDLLGSKAPINSLKLKKITKTCTFSNEKARRELGWEPLDVLEHYKI